MIAILFVTCCLERSRYEVVQHVIKNITERCPPEWRRDITVFDNASTYLGAGELLTTFSNVYRADRNVGYGSAIDWCLQHLADEAPWPVDGVTYTPRYTYIIESDMIHYGSSCLDNAAQLLDRHPELGACRLHEYSIADMRLYDKDRPVAGSRKGLWQSHTNKVTGKGVCHVKIDDGPFWRTNFLTQLPALNRYDAMKRCFDELKQLERFTELDFQRLYHAQHPDIAILDGGIFNCDLNPYGAPVVTGSWTDPRVLQRLGYQSTRFASITPRDQYTVTRLT